MSLFLGKIWELVKPNIPIVLLLVAASSGLFFFFSDKENVLAERMQQQMKAMQAIQEEEMRRIEAAAEKERQERAANLKRLEDDLSGVKTRYDSRLKTLEKKKSEQVSGLVNQFDSDPTGMAEKLGKLTGFKVVLPEQK